MAGVEFRAAVGASAFAYYIAQHGEQINYVQGMTADVAAAASLDPAFAFFAAVCVTV